MRRDCDNSATLELESNVSPSFRKFSEFFRRNQGASAIDSRTGSDGVLKVAQSAAANHDTYSECDAWPDPDRVDVKTERAKRLKQKFEARMRAHVQKKKDAGEPVYAVKSKCDASL